MEKWDIHQNIKQFESQLRLLKESNISERNKELIRRFIGYCQLESLSPGRLKKYCGMLRDLSEWIGKDLDTCSRADLEEVILKLLSNEIKPRWNNKPVFSEWTKREYVIVLRKFYTHLDKPEVIAKLKTLKKPTTTYTENDLLTEEEVTKIRDCFKHPRDLCLFDMLEESGCRISEIATVKINSLNFDQYGTRLLVSGKTGTRPIRLCKSSASIAKWISIHPLRKDTSAYLFVGIKGEHQPLTYTAIRRILDKAFIAAGVTKKRNPHFAFRHKKATELSNAGWSEYNICQWQGWTIGSPIAATYVKRSGRHVEEAALKLAGLKKEKEIETKPTVTICPRCELLNEATAKFCSRCGAALDLKTAITASEYNEKKSLVASRILENGIDLKTNEGKEQAIKLIEELKAKILLTP